MAYGCFFEFEGAIYDVEEAKIVPINNTFSGARDILSLTILVGYTERTTQQKRNAFPITLWGEEKIVPIQPFLKAGTFITVKGRLTSNPYQGALNRTLPNGQPVRYFPKLTPTFIRVEGRDFDLIQMAQDAASTPGRNNSEMPQQLENRVHNAAMQSSYEVIKQMQESPHSPISPQYNNPPPSQYYVQSPGGATPIYANQENNVLPQQQPMGQQGGYNNAHGSSQNQQQGQAYQMQYQGEPQLAVGQPLPEDMPRF